MIASLTHTRCIVFVLAVSTTVVNPSLWMPIYQTAPSQAIFFVVFIITCVFYYHSLVLSVVFQTYIQAVTEIHERSSSDREDAVRLSFLALMKDGQSDVINTSSVRKCLQVVRPHYNTLKMKALVDIVDPSNQHIIGYDAFRTKIRQALNASIRTARAATNLAMGVELIAVLVAVSNFLYVILVTAEWDQPWFDSIEAILGSIITLLGLLELVVRFNPLRVQNFAPITRLNFFFDGLALVAAVVSFVGIVQYVANYNPYEANEISDWLLMGRAIDMIRIMRFFPIFRDVVRRSTDVLPAMAGPLVLVLSIVHIFVYFGIIIWGNAIDVEALMENDDLVPLYCLNNFNSYVEGLVTMFNIMVVNDWHAIAAVYLYADRNSSRLIVYPFFVSAICISVFILLNVVTAFFVECKF
jgi:two pore calcium channel protein